MSSDERIRVRREGWQTWMLLPEELSARWRVLDGDALDYRVTSEGLHILPARDEEGEDLLLDELIRENEDVLRRLAR